MDGDSSLKSTGMPGTRSAQLGHMARLTLVGGLFALTAGLTTTGCGSTSANPSAPDGAAMTPDSPSGEASEAGSSTACAAAGGQCIAGDAICWGQGLAADCGNGGTACCKVVFDAGSCTEADAQAVHAASYDQSCKVDHDCVGISEGNSCDPCDFSCANATINAGALAKYTSDTSSFPAVLAVGLGACASSCGGPVGLCCLGGECHRGSPCPFEVLIGTDAAADTGATDASPDGGPADAHAE
jgi:hypothetical protein